MFPIVIGSNCCAGNYYHNLLNMRFYSPFIWAVTPYFSIQYMLDHWSEIDWDAFSIVANAQRPLTFSVIVDGKISIHYVHYFYQKQAKTPFTKGASVFFCNIEDFIREKYVERVHRMKTQGDMANPLFIIHEEAFANGNAVSRLKRIMTTKCAFKRFVVTHSFDLSGVIYDLSNVRYIHTPEKMLPQQMIEQYGDQINRFFEICPEYFNRNPAETATVQ